VLTLEGAAPTLGPVTVDLDAGSFEVIMRTREPADPRDLWLAWRESDASTAAELVKIEPRVVEPDGWVVASARVSAGTGGPRRVELSILFSGHDKGALDVAFVTVVQ
jgi:hypothetical protein